MNTVHHGCIAVAVGIAVIVLAASPVWADTVRLEVAGQSDARARAVDGDANTRAVDNAFAAGVGQVVDELSESRSADAALLAAARRQIVRRARRYVRSYRVMEQSEDDAGGVRVRISVLIDRALVAQMLDVQLEQGGPGREIDRGPGNTTGGTTVGGARSPAQSASAGRARPALTVLVAVSLAGGARYYAGGQGAPAPSSRGTESAQARAVAETLLTELTGRFRREGFTVLPAPGAMWPPAQEWSGDARELDVASLSAAATGEIGGAVVVHAEVGAATAIRGIHEYGAIGTISMRVFDIAAAAVEPTLVAVSGEEAAVFSTDVAVLTPQIADQLGRRGIEAVLPPMARYWPPPMLAQGWLQVAVEGYRDWRNIAVIITHLTATSGVERVWPRRLGSGGVILAVESSWSEARARQRLQTALAAIELRDGTVLSVRAQEQSLVVVMQAAEVTLP